MRRASRYLKVLTFQDISSTFFFHEKFVPLVQVWNIYEALKIMNMRSLESHPYLCNEVASVGAVPCVALAGDSKGRE
jgi:hypothetical protein